MKLNLTEVRLTSVKSVSICDVRNGFDQKP